MMLLKEQSHHDQLGQTLLKKNLIQPEALRLAMRLVKVDPTTAQSMAAAAVAGGVMTSIADNARESPPNMPALPKRTLSPLVWAARSSGPLYGSPTPVGSMSMCCSFVAAT